MSQVTQLREAVSRLSTPVRAELAASLLDTLDDTHHWISDEEVLRRWEELDSGAVRGLTLSDFKAACGRCSRLVDGFGFPPTGPTGFMGHCNQLWGAHSCNSVGDPRVGSQALILMTSPIKSACDIWDHYECDFRDLAEESVSSADDDVLQWKLHQADWFLYLLSNVIGIWSNCGSLVTGLAAFAKYQSDLELALNLFGFPATAANVQASIVLDRDSKKHGEWTAEFELRRNQIENNCDWSFAQLVDYIRCHDEDFGLSILPYCD